MAATQADVSPDLHETPPPQESRGQAALEARGSLVVLFAMCKEVLAVHVCSADVSRVQPCSGRQRPLQAGAVLLQAAPQLVVETQQFGIFSLKGLFEEGGRCRRQMDEDRWRQRQTTAPHTLYRHVSTSQGSSLSKKQLKQNRFYLSFFSVSFFSGESRGGGARVCLSLTNPHYQAQTHLQSLCGTPP